MNMKKFRLTSLLLAVCLVVSVFVPMGVMASENPVAIYIDRDIIDKDGFIDDSGRTQAPVRAFAEKMGCTVGWVQETQTVQITQEYTYNVFENNKMVPKTVSNYIELSVGDNKIYKNNASEIIEMDTKAVIVNGSTFVPVRFVAEALDAVVGWNSAYSYVDIKSAAKNKGDRLLSGVAVPCGTDVEFIEGAEGIISFRINYNNDVTKQKEEINTVIGKIVNKELLTAIQNMLNAKTDTTQTINNKYIKQNSTNTEVTFYDSGDVVSVRIER